MITDQASKAYEASAKTLEALKGIANLTDVGTVQIPIHRGHLLRFDRGQATDLIAATIPI
jgi:hypothetical protein